MNGKDFLGKLLTEIQSQHDREHDYFECLRYINENAKATEFMGNHLMKLSIAEQLPYIKALKIVAEISVDIYERHKDEFEEDENNGDL